MSRRTGPAGARRARRGMPRRAVIWHRRAMPAAPTHSRIHAGWSLLVACALASVQIGLLLDVAWDKSDTADETRYVASGAFVWASGEYRDLCEAPALPKLAFGGALRLAGVSTVAAATGWQSAADELFTGRSPETLRRTFFAARCATIAVVVLAGFLVRAAALRLGPNVATIAHALWCFSPTLLANGALAALDAWAAALMAVVLWAQGRLLERSTGARAVMLGVATGCAAATKITTLLALPLSCGVLLAAASRMGQPIARRFRAAASLLLFATAAVVTLWLVYGGSVGGIGMADPCPFSIAGVPPIAGWLPFPAWLEGVVFQLRHGEVGHPSYLFGELRTSGWWWFYLACLALKVPIGTQALAALGLAARFAAARGLRDLALDAALLAFPLGLLVAMSAGHHQAGVAFLLPALPFVCVWLGLAAATAGTAFGRAGRWAGGCLIVLAVVETLHVHPHYLMFFNTWAGGPANGPRYLVHRDDWGQDKRRLAEWQRRHGVARLFYAGYGAHAEEWGIVAAPVPCTPTIGVYALHAVEVHRPQFSLRPGCIDWLTVEPPDERIGFSIYLYTVDAARLRRLTEPHAEPPFWRSGAAQPSAFADGS